MKRPLSTRREILIIYNPNSTGNGKVLAGQLKSELAELRVSATLQATKAAGDGYKIARGYADKYPMNMIISASGDGGFHEVVNGVMDSTNPTTVVGVLPAGNANDHYHGVQTSPERPEHPDLAHRIAGWDVKKIDLLRVSTSSWTKYAHSYVGLGMTSQIGKKLTEAKLNAFMETWIVIRNLIRVRPVKIIHNGESERYDNLVFSNIGRMSKYLHLASDSSITDGKFEITRVKSGSFKHLARHIFRASTKSIKRPLQTSSYEFELIRASSIQLDGEVYNLPAHCKVTVTSMPLGLHEIV